MRKGMGLVYMSRVDDVLRNMLSLIRRTTSKVKIVEVGPRDGLQNEPKHLSVDTKVSFIEKLVHCGLSHVEVGSFTKLPQMKDTDKVLDQLQRTGTIYSALVPNRKGMDLAAAHKASEVAIFTAASESFTHKNINCSIQESLDRFKPVVSMAAAKGIPVRGYVSCIAQCPYEGKIQPSQVAIVTEALFKMGCHEVSLGDTIGVATPGAIESVLKAVLAIAPVSQLAIHCHDTYGQALANILQSIHMGIQTVDASTGGLGGCPYAPGATGNVATEDVLYMLHGMGVSTGVSLDKVHEVGKWINGEIGRQSTSRYALAQVNG